MTLHRGTTAVCEAQLQMASRLAHRALGTTAVCEAQMQRSRQEVRLRCVMLKCKWQIRNKRRGGGVIESSGLARLRGPRREPHLSQTTPPINNPNPLTTHTDRHVCSYKSGSVAVN